MNVALMLVALLAAAVSVICSLGDVDRDRVIRLERAAAKLIDDVTDLRQRVLQLERPNEPVYPPRHPGRIGGHPVIPWIEPWSGSRPTLGTEIGSTSESTIGRTIDQ